MWVTYEYSAVTHGGLCSITLRQFMIPSAANEVVALKTFSYRFATFMRFLLGPPTPDMSGSVNISMKKLFWSILSQSCVSCCSSVIPSGNIQLNWGMLCTLWHCHSAVSANSWPHTIDSPIAILPVLPHTYACSAQPSRDEQAFQIYGSAGSQNFRKKLGLDRINSVQT